MTNLQLKHLSNRILNEIAVRSLTTDNQIESIRAMASQLSAEAAAQELVARAKENAA